MVVEVYTYSRLKGKFMILSIKKNIDILLVTTIVITLSAIGKICTEIGMPWYQLLSLPAVTPPDWVFGIVWTALYVMAGCAAVILIREFKHNNYYYLIIKFFLIMALLNAAWSYMFFVNRSISGALIDCIVLFLTCCSIIALTWRQARTVALLLLPNALWIAFALYLNYQILLLN